MFSDSYCERISNDWLWREKDLRAMDAMLLKKFGDIGYKSSILIVYSHWEGHFKFCASQLLDFISDGIKRKIFRWTDIRPDIRQRILFCNYRRSSISGQSQETFISYLNALNDDRYAGALAAKDEVIMIDDNLNSSRAEAICRNFGLDCSWFILKKVIIDERLLEHRNAIAHGARTLRSGDEMDFSDDTVTKTIEEVRMLIRECKNRFENALVEKSFLERRAPHIVAKR